MSFAQKGVPWTQQELDGWDRFQRSEAKSLYTNQVFRSGARVWVVLGHGRSGKDEFLDFLKNNWPQMGITECPFMGAMSTSQAATPAVAAALDQSVTTAYQERHNHREFWFRFCNLLRARISPSVLIDRGLFVLREAYQCLYGMHDSTVDRVPGLMLINGLRNFSELPHAASRSLRTEFIWIDRPGTPADPTMDYTSADYLKFAQSCDVPGTRFHWLVNDRELVDFHRKITSLTQYVFATQAVYMPGLSFAL